MKKRNPTIKKKTSKAGRPRIDLEKVFAKIEPFLNLGYKLPEACDLANLPKRQPQQYYYDDEDFRMKIDAARRVVTTIAKKNFVKEINNGDIDASEKWLKAYEKDTWGTKKTESKVEGKLALSQVLDAWIADDEEEEDE